MISVDTNVLVRILADDPDQPAQVEAARVLASRSGQIFVPLIVQIETVWVMESGYDLPKETILQALEHLHRNQAFVLENAVLSRQALELFRNTNADYSDCLILCESRGRDLILHTFDKRLGKLEGANRVQV